MSGKKEMEALRKPNPAAPQSWENAMEKKSSAADQQFGS
jgi:hypothetical protein